jgi:hypothetical protein
MHLVLASLLAVATTPPTEPVAAFEEWASGNGTPVDSPACDVPDSGPIVCYGLTEGSVVIVAEASRNADGSISSFSERQVASPAPTAGETTTSDSTTTVPISDPLLPVEPGATGPVVAAIQGRIGVAVDCDFGNQTRSAVEQWQATAGIPVTGTIDLPAWELLEVPMTWGDDANGNGTIEPSEVSLVCDGAVELPPVPPPPLDTTGWPETELATVAATCSIPDEFGYSGDGGPDVRYNPDEDMISIIGAGSADDPERGDQVFDTMVCVLAHSGAPDRVVTQISQARAQDREQFAVWEGMVVQWNHDPASGTTLTIYSTADTSSQDTSS